MKIESEIRNIINDIIGGKYIGKLKVEKEDMDDDTPLWTLLLYLNTDEAPLILAYQGSEECFKSFIIKEMKRRTLEEVQFWEIKREEYKNDNNYE